MKNIRNLGLAFEMFKFTYMGTPTNHDKIHQILSLLNEYNIQHGQVEKGIVIYETELRADILQKILTIGIRAISTRGFDNIHLEL